MERLQIFPDKPSRYSTLDVRRSHVLPQPAEIHEAHPQATAASSSFNSKKGKNSMNNSQSNFNSPKAQQLHFERQEIDLATEELEREVKIAMTLIRAQYQLHQLTMDQGTFFF